MIRTRMILKYLLLLFIIVNFIVVTYTKRNYFLRPYDHEYLAHIYSNSQYIKGTEATSSIGDDALFAVAGYYLTLQGGDPTQIHFESPPLGEYLIGLSILIFRNERVINILYIVLFFFFTYQFGVLIFNDKLVSLFAVLFLSLDPLLTQHMTISLLDLPQALFMLIGIYIFTSVVVAKKSIAYFFYSSLFLGLATATKFFPAITFILLILGIWCFKHAHKKFHFWLNSLAIIPIIYLISYTMFFFHDHTLLDFVNFQKWMLVWRMGNPYKIGNIFLTYLFGKYQSWWLPTEWIEFKEWTVLNPLLLIGATFSLILLDRKNPLHTYLYLIMIVFIIYVAITTTGVAKYLFPVYPFLALFTSYTIFVSCKRLINPLFAILSKWKLIKRPF